MGKPGKYTHVIGNLPRLPEGATTNYQNDVVAAAKEEILQPWIEGDPAWGKSTLEIAIKELEELFEATHMGLKRVAAYTARQSFAPASSPSEFAQGYVLLRRLKDKMEEWESNTNLLLEAYTQLMSKALDDQGLSAVKLTTGESVSTYLEPYPTVKDQEAFRQWCIKSGFANMMHLHPSRTASLAKEMLEKGENPPPGVEIYAKTRVRLMR
jgi:hypothetical protein